MAKDKTRAVRRKYEEMQRKHELMLKNGDKVKKLKRNHRKDMVNEHLNAAAQGECF